MLVLRAAMLAPACTYIGIGPRVGMKEHIGHGILHLLVREVSGGEGGAAPWTGTGVDPAAQAIAATTVTSVSGLDGEARLQDDTGRTCEGAHGLDLDFDFYITLSLLMLRRLLRVRGRGGGVSRRRQRKSNDIVLVTGRAIVTHRFVLTRGPH